MKTIVIANNKGGVAKTTTAIAIAAGLARQGRRTLLLDIDPQSNCSQSIRLTDEAGDTAELLRGKRVQPVEVSANLSAVASAGKDLITIDAEVKAVQEGTAIATALKQYREQFDYVVIDTAPAIGLLTINALKAADFVAIPMQANYLALQGMAQLTELLQQLGKADNIGVVVTQYDKRKTMSRQLLETIKGYFGPAVFSTAVRNNIAIAEAPAAGQLLYDYAPKSHGAGDYTAITAELLERLEK